MAGLWILWQRWWMHYGIYTLILCLHSFEAVTLANSILDCPWKAFYRELTHLLMNGPCLCQNGDIPHGPVVFTLLQVASFNCMVMKTQVQDRARSWIPLFRQCSKLELYFLRFVDMRIRVFIHTHLVRRNIEAAWWFFEYAHPTLFFPFGPCLAQPGFNSSAQTPVHPLWTIAIFTFLLWACLFSIRFVITLIDI